VVKTLDIRNDNNVSPQIGIRTTRNQAEAQKPSPMQIEQDNGISTDDLFLKHSMEKPLQEVCETAVETTCEPPKSLIIPEELKSIPKDLYEVSGDGKTKKVTFIYDTGNRDTLDNLVLVGSWDNNTGRYTNVWKNSEVAMTKGENGVWSASIDLLDEGQHKWEWGVLADAPAGKKQWAIFEEGNLPVDMKSDNPVNEYSPTTYHKMGATRNENDANFRFWAPGAENVKVRIWDEDFDKPQYIQMEKDPKTNMWSTTARNSWDKLNGKCYAYEVETREGQTQVKADPYSRYLMDSQKGLGLIYLNPENGKEVHKFWKASDGKTEGEKFARFEVNQQGDAEAVYLSFRDENGKPMDKESLLQRLGEGKKDLVGKHHNDKFSDHWLSNIDDKGRISMAKQGKSWSSIVNNPEKLPGLHYQFEVHKKDADGRTYILGDTNKDGVLSEKEARKTTYNDSYSGVIEEKIGWLRYGVIKESDYVWKNDDVPRETTQREKMVIYQAHVGSVFGDKKNLDRSTFKDVIDRLDYFKELGVNAIEILPPTPLEAGRDWGYYGDQYMAHAEDYGFVDDKGNWVAGADAVKMFVDAAHGKGLNVFSDVVYNHLGAEYNNIWKIDGKTNSYFNWKPESFDEPAPVVEENLIAENGRSDSEKVDRTLDEDGLKHTPWGTMPAYNKKPVSQFFVDHAMMQLDEFKFDGLRFDFTNKMHVPGWGGGQDGWEMLRKTNKLAHFFNPKAITAAEEFPNSEIITTPCQPNGKGGAGFDAMWNTEFQHRLIHDHHNPAILQQAAQGNRTNMDKFMGHMISPEGFSSYSNSKTMISNHDEVGNAARIVNVATNHTKPEVPDQWARNSSRLVFGVGVLAPGTPFFFQGCESLANNAFSWGIPSTWDVGWDWKDVGNDLNWKDVTFNEKTVEKFNNILEKPEDERKDSKEYGSLSDTDKKLFDYVASNPVEDRGRAMYNIMRKQQFNFSRDIIALRKNSPAFDGDAETRRVYTHNDDSVMAFSRKKEGEEFLVIASLNKNDLQHYRIPFEKGKYQMVFNSDAKQYGGKDYGSISEVDASVPNFDIPRGGLLVYKRVG
jgi:maltooligosyltrehalose trehalohydrolase